MKTLVDRVFSWFETRIDPFASRADYEPPSGFFPYVWHYVRQAKLWFFLMALAGFLNAGIEALVFTFVGEIVDLLATFEAERDAGWEGLADFAGWTLLGMVFVTLVVRVIVIAIAALLEEQIVVPGFFTLMRWQSHQHIFSQSLSFFQNDLSGRIAQKVFQTGHAMGDMMTSLIQTIGFISAYTLTTFGLLLSLQFQLGLTVMIWIVGFGLLAKFFIPRIRRHGRRTAEAGAVATGRMVDGYSNISTVKLHGATSQENDWVKEGIAGQYNALRLFTRDLTGVRVSLATLSNTMVCLIAWQAIDLWLSREITTGEVAFSLALVLRLSLLLNRLMGILNGFFRNVGVVQNSMELIAQPLQIRDVPEARSLAVTEGRISFDDVRFNYGKDGNFIDGLSLVVNPGEKVGIIGPSGAGKTTLVSLLLRFFEPDGGTIRVDGQDIAKVTQDSLRSQFSVVQQETAIFHRSIRDNIAHGRPSASLNEIIAAARQAEADGFIRGLSDSRGRRGYDAHIGERGVQLSGGQRQRISVARVFLRNAPLLILDEATSQLDSGVEQAIRENLLSLMDGKTVLAIAHRLSTIAAMDRLVVIDNGRIVEEGNHAELVSRNGLYARLWNLQSGGFLGEHAE